MSWLSQTADAEPALDVASPVSRAVHGIWEADELFRCPLVGMGITLAEQKHLLKKMSLPAVELTPFECTNCSSMPPLRKTLCPGR